MDWYTSVALSLFYFLLLFWAAALFRVVVEDFFDRALNFSEEEYLHYTITKLLPRKPKETEREYLIRLICFSERVFERYWLSFSSRDGEGPRGQ